MAIQYRLTKEQTREWRTNQGMLVHTPEDGPSEVVRAATAEEVNASFEHLKYIQAQPPERRKKMEPFAVLVDGKKCNIISIREVLQAEILEHQGKGQDVVLRSNNGRTIRVLRANPDAQVAAVAQTPGGVPVPQPDNCVCAKWAGREPGKHHFICVNNKHAPPEQQGTEQVVGAIATAQGMVDHKTLLGSRVEPPKREEVLEPPEPAECECANWAKPESARQDSHHPVCKWKTRWETKMRKGKHWFIKDVETGQIKRGATEEEVLLSERALELDGAPLINIDGKEYAVEAAENDKRLDQDKPAPEADEVES